MKTQTNDPVNLDRIGRIGQLAFQYVAVLRLGDVSDSANAIVTYNQVRRELTGPEIEDMRGALMDELLLKQCGGEEGMAEFDELVLLLRKVAPEIAEGVGREFGPPAR